MYLYIISDMEKMKLSVEKILIGLLVAALGGTGVLVYRNHSRNIPSKETSTPSANVTATPTTIPTEAPTPIESDEIKHMDALVTPYSNKKYAPITADNTTGFQTGWVVQNNGGYSWGDITFNDIHIDVYNGGENSDGVIFYRDGIPFDAGVGYTIYFSLNSTVEKDIPINVVNADTGAVIYSENIHATSSSNSYSISFTSNVSTWNGSVRFLIGGGSENHPREPRHQHQGNRHRAVLLADGAADLHAARPAGLGRIHVYDAPRRRCRRHHGHRQEQRQDLRQGTDR